jgi:hypothetical protein
MGLLAVFLYHYLAVGHWDAFFQQQLSFDHRLSNPMATLVTHLAPLLHPAAAGRVLVPSLQTLVVLGLVAATAAVAFLRREMLDRLDVLVLVYVGVFWLVPQAVGSGLSIYRAESLLLPAVALLVRLRAVVLALLVAVCAALATGMAVLFFETVLV